MEVVHGDPYYLRPLLSSEGRDFLVRHNGDPYDLRSLLSSEGRDGDPYDLRSLLSSEGRDFLVRHNGDQVKIGELDGKIVGVYFSAHWCRPCRRFTPKLADVYKELPTNGGFEVVFVSADTDEESFKEYFSSMPWLAIPFSDSTVRENLDDLFKVQRIPHLVILDGNRKLLTKDGVRVIGDYSAEGMEELAAREEAARKAQNLPSILVSGERDFVISNDGKNVPISELQGKIVGLYFYVNSFPPCRNFTKNLIQLYQELKDKGASFEVVLISFDSDENSFKEQFQAMPWFALPYNDKACAKLLRYFELNSLPTLVIIGTDGKTELIGNHGLNAYPFSLEKLAELAELEKRRLESRTLESLLVTSERDFVIGGGVKIPVSKLVGKTILLYFSAERCGRAFLPKLIQAYNEIKEKGEAFEVIFISSDKDQESFGKFFSEMPWLALPYGDATRKSLRRTFEIKDNPTLVAIGPDGRTVTTEAWKLLTVHGSDAYPFTEHRLKELDALQEEEKKKKANEEEEEKKKKANEEEEEKKKNANEEDGEKKNAKEDEENKNANEEDGEKKNDNEDEEKKKANEEDGKHGDHEQDGQKERYMRVKLVLKLAFPMFNFLASLERRWGNVV